MSPDSDALSPYVPQFPTLLSMGGAPLYTTGEESLKVVVFNAGAGVTVTVSGRTLALGDTRPSPFKQTFTPATDRSSSTSLVKLPPGWLLNAQAVVTGGTPVLGQTFARLSIAHGDGAVGDESIALCADYITAKQPISYPGSLVTDPTDGAGALRSIAGATPGAGAEISETVPTGARWELLAFRAQLVTAAAVANRVPVLTLDDGTTVYAASPAGLAQAATLTEKYTWAQAYPQPAAIAAAEVVAPLPNNIRLGSGHRIRTATANIQGADQYSAIQYLVREWIEGA